MRYLDPKADLTFKRVFGDHPDLVISFLNALLPFQGKAEEIVRVEHLNWDVTPPNPLPENNIMNIQCKDNSDRQFIVEIQMMWTSRYKHQVVFNNSKVCINQLRKKEDFELQQPVYSLNLVDENFSSSPEYYHDFPIVETGQPPKTIDGMRCIFVELPKVTPLNCENKKTRALWLRYLTEINEKIRKAPQELMENPDISKAIEQVEESNFTPAQLRGYDKFWDTVSTAKMFLSSARKERLKEVYKRNYEEGYKEGRLLSALETARKMKAKGYSADTISELTGLSAEDIEKA